MSLRLTARFLGKNGRIHRTLFSTSSLTQTTNKPSVLLVNHGYPPLFNAGSEVKRIFLLKN
jgi:hypothetical protein